MATPLNAINLNVAGSAAKPKDTPERIKTAAQQFEALLISQMMKSMRDSEGGGWMGTGDDDSASSAMEYGQEIFAQSMAKSGGLGLANLVSQGLANKTADPES